MKREENIRNKSNSNKIFDESNFHLLRRIWGEEIDRGVLRMNEWGNVKLELKKKCLNDILIKNCGFITHFLDKGCYIK